MCFLDGRRFSRMNGHCATVFFSAVWRLDDDTMTSVDIIFCAKTHNRDGDDGMHGVACPYRKDSPLAGFFEACLRLGFWHSQDSRTRMQQQLVALVQPSANDAFCGSRKVMNIAECVRHYKREEKLLSMLRLDAPLVPPA